MLSIFKKKKQEDWYAYCSGECIAIEDVPDEIFSTKMMGEGIAMIAKAGDVYAPMDGIIRLVAPTKHAIAIETTSKTQILLHVGLDSANLPEGCFQVYVQEGDCVKKGQKVLHIQEDYLMSLENLYIPMVLVENPQQISFDAPPVSKTMIGGESVIFSYEY